jgi:Ca2+-binding RTX toxin-like protein
VAATAGNNTISTGDGADTVTGGTGADTINGQAGNDIFVFASANLNSSDTINGGDGDDTIRMSNDSTVVDADFTNASSIKTLTASGTSNLSVSLAAQAAESGLSVITLVDDQADSVTLAAGFTNNLTINMASDANAGDSIVATNYTGALTVAADISELDSNASTLTGGTGSDTLQITVSTSATANLGSVTNFETIDIGGDGADADTITITTADTLVASGATLTIDGADLEDGAADDILAFNGSNETNGNFVITTDGAGAHTITLGNGNDTYTGSGSGATTITATAGTNSITAGTGADTITAGSGTDTIAGGTGSDTFVFGSATNALNDSITDFATADDQISVTLDYSSLLSGVVVNGNRTSTGVEGLTAAEATLTGQRGEYVYDTTNSKLYVNMTADASISGADVQVGINAAATAANTIAAGDVNFTVTGTTSNDTIVTGAGTDTINADDGADTVNMGAGSDTYTLATGDSKALTAETVTEASLGATDTITFGNGVDIINGFAAGATNDTINGANAGAASTAVGVDFRNDNSGTTFFFDGGYNATTGVFTGNAGGADLLIFEGDSNANLASIDTFVVLVGVAQTDLHADNFT